MKKRDYSLTEGIIWKSILFFAVPIMLSNLLQQLYSAVDSSIVGIFAGSMPLAAVGSSGALINLLVGYCWNDDLQCWSWNNKGKRRFEASTLLSFCKWSA